jgi:hypothetical protein
VALSFAQERTGWLAEAKSGSPLPSTVERGLASGHLAVYAKYTVSTSPVVSPVAPEFHRKSDLCLVREMTKRS